MSQSHRSVAESAKAHAPLRVLLISNAGSGQNRRDFAAFEQRIQRYPWVSHVTTNSPEEADACLAAWRDAPPDYLIVNGGDGTAAHIFGLVLTLWTPEQRPPLVVLPGGTANMTAGDLGLSGSRKKALKRLFRWLDRGCREAGSSSQRWVMRLEPYPGAKVHHGVFLGAGVIVQATQYAHQSIHSRGLGGGISLGLVLLRTVWGLIHRDPHFYQSLGLDFTFEQARTGGAPEAEPTRFSGHLKMVILVASSLERLFLGINPFWVGGRQPLRLTFVDEGATRFLSTFSSIIRGRANRHAQPQNGYQSYRAEQALISFDGQFNMDGEIIEVSRARGPAQLSAEGPLNFVRPR